MEKNLRISGRMVGRVAYCDVTRVGESSQIITMDIIDLVVAAQSSDAIIACSENRVHFFRRQLTSTKAAQYALRHDLLLQR